MALLFPPVTSRGRFLIHKTVEEYFPELGSISVGRDLDRRTLVTWSRLIQKQEEKNQSCKYQQREETEHTRDYLESSDTNKEEILIEFIHQEDKMGSEKCSQEPTQSKQSRVRQTQNIYTPPAARVNNREFTRPHGSTPKKIRDDGISLDDVHKNLSEKFHEAVQSKKHSKRPDQQLYVPKGKRSFGPSPSPFNKNFDDRPVSPANSICSVVSEFSGYKRYGGGKKNENRSEQWSESPRNYYGRQSYGKKELTEKCLNQKSNYDYSGQIEYKNSKGRSPRNHHHKENVQQFNNERNRNNKNRKFNRTNSYSDLPANASYNYQRDFQNGHYFKHDSASSGRWRQGFDRPASSASLINYDYDRIRTENQQAVLSPLMNDSSFNQAPNGHATRVHRPDHHVNSSNNQKEIFREPHHVTSPAKYGNYQREYYDHQGTYDNYSSPKRYPGSCNKNSVSSPNYRDSSVRSHIHDSNERHRGKPGFYHSNLNKGNYWMHDFRDNNDDESSMGSPSHNSTHISETKNEQNDQPDSRTLKASNSLGESVEKRLLLSDVELIPLETASPPKYNETPVTQVQNSPSHETTLPTIESLEKAKPDVESPSSAKVYVEEITVESPEIARLPQISPVGNEVDSSETLQINSTEVSFESSEIQPPETALDPTCSPKINCAEPSLDHLESQITDNAESSLTSSQVGSVASNVQVSEKSKALSPNTISIDSSNSSEENVPTTTEVPTSDLADCSAQESEKTSEHVSWADLEDWESLYDETGSSVKVEVEEELGKVMKPNVSIKQPNNDYKEFQPEPSNIDSRYGNVIEIYGFPTSFKIIDMQAVFQKYKNMDIRWVDDTHALGIFDTKLAATDGLNINHPFVKTRRLSEGIPKSISKALRSTDGILPHKDRPTTSASAARRMVGLALGCSIKVPDGVRNAERNRIQVAQEERRRSRRLKEEAWEGTLQNMI